ncbi:MAG TPA: type II toxin-antitoxin system antitoxin SocA domain-containing protein, partial [Verrucomicrobiae bacterium]
MEKPFKSIAVANRFIELAQKSDSKLTLMKLLKIVYFAHGWHLALRDKSPLIDDTVEAWKFGPV